MEHALRIIVLLVVGTAALAANESAGSQGARYGSARAISDGFVDTWNRHDMAAFGALYAENADFVNVRGLWLRGRDAIQEHHAGRANENHSPYRTGDGGALPTCGCGAGSRALGTNWSDRSGWRGPSAQARHPVPRSCPDRRQMAHHLITKHGYCRDTQCTCHPLRTGNRA
jgi:hypothetical protein